MTHMHHQNDLMQERIFKLKADLSRYMGEVARLRGVMNKVVDSESGARCELCWDKKKTLRDEMYPRKKGKQ